jgi:CubicO group peptidase (beta-lactamase class C family)
VLAGLGTLLGTGAQAQIASEPIPVSQLQEKCGLDPDIMAGVDRYFFQGRPFVVYRNGYFCWRSSGATAALHQLPVEVFSSTKTFGAMLVGAVIARSSLRDSSPLTDWLTPAELSLYAPSINQRATVAHVLAMTAWSKDLAYGRKEPWTYDAAGLREINVLIPLMTRVIQREPERFEGARDVQQFAARFLKKLGMTQTTWPGFSIALSLQSTSADLGRLGELVLRRGVWNGERIIDEQYLYRMTHAAFSDSTTGYGYLTYINAAANNTGLGLTYDSQCAPYARWSSYPHAPFFEAPNSNGGYPFSDPAQDIGLVWSQGAAYSTFAVHRGLDMVLGSSISAPSIVSGLQDVEGTNQNWLWNNVRPALLAGLTEFGNSEAAFCSVYRTGKWSQTRSPWSAGASL